MISRVQLSGWSTQAAARKTSDEDAEKAEQIAEETLTDD